MDHNLHQSPPESSRLLIQPCTVQSLFFPEQWGEWRIWKGKYNNTDKNGDKANIKRHQVQDMQHRNLPNKCRPKICLREAQWSTAGKSRSYRYTQVLPKKNQACIYLSFMDQNKAWYHWINILLISVALHKTFPVLYLILCVFSIYRAQVYIASTFIPLPVINEHFHTAGTGHFFFLRGVPLFRLGRPFL